VETHFIVWYSVSKTHTKTQKKWVDNIAVLLVSLALAIVVLTTFE